MIKILVVSDIHYPIRRLELPNLERYVSKADMILGLGDFVDIQVVSYLKSFGKPFAGVHGNMDFDDVKRSLPETFVLNVGGINIGLYHGNGGPKGIEKRVFSKFNGKNIDAYLFGHSHKPVNRYIDGKFYFNPGTLCGARQTLGFVYIDFDNIRGEIKTYSDNA